MPAIPPPRTSSAAPHPAHLQPGTFRFDIALHPLVDNELDLTPLDASSATTPPVPAPTTRTSCSKSCYWPTSAASSPLPTTPGGDASGLKGKTAAHWAPCRARIDAVFGFGVQSKHPNDPVHSVSSHSHRACRHDPSRRKAGYYPVSLGFTTHTQRRCRERNKTCTRLRAGKLK